MNMQLGMIGLGRMGANMVQRLMRGGHECVVFDMKARERKQASETWCGRREVARRLRLQVKAATRCLADGACRGRR